MSLRRDVPILLAAVAAIIGASLDGDGRWLHWIAKPLATLLIAGMVLRSAGLWPATDAPSANRTYARAILLGMAFSCIGDIALMLPFDAFVPGLIAFLLAHLCYIVAFRAGFRAGRGLLFAAALLAVFAGINLSGLWPLLPNELRIPVVVYVIVLALMATLALARAWTKRASTSSVPASARWAAIGAVLFVISDSVLAWDRFGGGLPAATLCVLSTYYAAQYCIARSVR
ncbi:lysoplasmalogenase [Stenotrophomonas sp. ISL-67]|uniref:lysoplasmalogenase n=1 Tax=Stenotrophomonas sp. ISL-67 TaxID=2819171 RepID=UPI001BED13F8|nr:lysoplasmalogenase [Stenotrophomonas sp. ISL-67]MBT2766344.1 lysoplasmalogenase [Stenotrophomonas sp. ISL-67]